MNLAQNVLSVLSKCVCVCVFFGGGGDSTCGDATSTAQNTFLRWLKISVIFIKKNICVTQQRCFHDLHYNNLVILRLLWFQGFCSTTKSFLPRWNFPNAMRFRGLFAFAHGCHAQWPALTLGTLHPESIAGHHC